MRGAAAAGFDGLWVDGFGFADAPVRLAALTKLTGSQPTTSEDGRFSFFDLRPYATRCGASSGPSASARSGGRRCTRPAAVT